MAVVLAIEPGRAQAELLREVHAALGVDLVIVASKDDAIAEIDRQLPDLILVNALLSPREENDLVAHLRSLEDASHLQLLTIPLLARNPAAADTRKSLFGFGKKRRAPVVSDGCELGAFGEQVTAYLARAQEVKSHPRPRLSTPVVRPQPPAADEPAARYGPQTAAAAYGGDVTPIYEPPARSFETAASEAAANETLAIPDVDRLFDELGFAPAEFEAKPVLGMPESADLHPDDAHAAPRTSVATDSRGTESLSSLSGSTSGTYDSYLDVPPSVDEPLIVLDGPAGTMDGLDGEIEITLADSDWPLTAPDHTAEAETDPPALEQPPAECGPSGADAVLPLGHVAPEVASIEPAAALDLPSTESEPLRTGLPGRSDDADVCTADPATAVAESVGPATVVAPAAIEDARHAASRDVRIPDRDLARIRAEAEAALAAELDRVRNEAAQQRERELAHWQAEAEALREATVGRARAEAEAEAREALAEELARSRAESERTRQDELARLQAEADERLEEVTREARQVAESEAARAFAEELARVRAASEAAAARALDDEVTRVRAEADSRLQAELERVRREAEEARRAEQAAAHAEAERIREVAAREARQIAEAAAARTLDAEIQRVRAEAEAVRAAAEARLAEQTKAQAEATNALAEAERIREAAAREAREAAAREAREVAETTAARKLEAELQRVHADAEARLKEQREAQIKAEKAREAAAREARAIAEATAAQALEAEIRRVKSEADARLSAELKALRADAERRRQSELEQMRQQVEEMRLAAAEQARVAAAEAIAAEVARAAALRGAAGPTKTVPVVRVGGPNASGTGPAPVLPAPAAPPRTTVPFESKTPSSSYYDLWRDEGSPPLDEPTRPAAASEPSRFRRRPWMMPAAAAALLVVCGSIGVSVNAVGWATSAKKALASALPSASPTPKPAAAAVEAPPTGDLLVETTPKGAAVTVDGKPRGKTPLTVTGLTPGKHTLALRSSDGVVIQREVLVRVGERAVSSELMVSGWLSVASRIPVEVHVAGKRLGTSGDGQIMMSPGRHKVTFVSRKFNIRETQTVEVRAGSISSHTLKLPSGSLTVDGPEGAEVLVDGNRIGAAPLRGAAVPVGTRDIVIRHPSFGERHQTIDIRYGTPATLSIGAAAAPQPGQSFDGLKILQESAANPGVRRRPQ